MTDDGDFVFGLCRTRFFGYHGTRLLPAAAPTETISSSAPAGQAAPPGTAEVAHGE